MILKWRYLLYLGSRKRLALVKENMALDFELLRGEKLIASRVLEGFVCILVSSIYNFV